MTSDSDTTSELLEWMRWYADTRMSSLLMDERRSLPLAMVRDFASMGLLGLRIPEQYQGLDLSWENIVRIFIQAGSMDCNVSVLLSVQNTLGIPPVQLFSSESAKKEILPRLTQGTLITSAISEPGIGSYLRGITTRATRRPDGSYTINGLKKWISLGGDARYVNVFADLYDEDGANIGITGFTVETNQPGFIVGPEEMTLGLRAIPQNNLIFENLRVDAENRLGEEGEGLRVAKLAFGQGRLTLAAGALGAMMRSLELAHRFATKRHVATGPLAENGKTQQILTDAVAATQAVHTLVHCIGVELDTVAEVPELLLFTAKYLGCELAFQVVDRCVQLLGARGYLDSNITGKLFRDYRLFRIFEGASEALQVYVGTGLLRNPRGLYGMTYAASPEIQEITERIVELAERETASPQQRHVLAGTVGDLACWTTLATVVGATADRGPGHAHAASWCLRRLRRRLRDAHDTVADDLLTSDEIATAIDGYTNSIGDLQGRRKLLGEHRDLDSLLR